MISWPDWCWRRCWSRLELPTPWRPALPGIYGLYATIIPLLVYALFGPSRILVLGPDSALAAVILSVVLPLSGGDPLRAVTLAGMLAIVSGTVCILAGVARLGFVTELHLQADPVRLHERNCIDRTDQPTARAFRFLDRGRRTVARPVGDRRRDPGGTNELGGSCDRGGHAGGDPAAPGQQARAGHSDCGGRCDRDRRQRSTSPRVTAWRFWVPFRRVCRASSFPWISYADIAPVLIGGCAIALVSFADTSVLSRAYAGRTGTHVDPNQEMVGLGAANLAAGFFQGFPISSSSSRTPVAEAAGARTQLTSVVAALIIAFLLLTAPNLLQNLPKTALAAVVIASAIGLIEVTDLKRIYRIQRWEFWLSIVCLVGVAVLGAIPGIGLAIAIAIIQFLWDGWRPHSAVLGRAHGVKGYHDITRYPDARRIPGLVLFRWDAPLFFANAELFKERVLDAVANSPTPVRWLVVAAEPVTGIDVTAGDTVAELDNALHAMGIELCFAELKDPVKDKLKRFGLFAQLGESFFFPTIGVAVSRYLKLHDVDWVDWEEQS